ncbi:MAG: ABC transporter ATP-binding protein [Tessaracoccus sp.]|uniref:ABC transporter ATP-binding protein/permease n=1 Tax=Tessaracoccus sp. TaxID=1971211 RepID=UPI001EB4C6F6|nr:ABC transporter ATP-binding protein [Tessaracoccus sp.]MBK7819515.1 ABC transporter ATP-binding protein [Tessaracoccus sp.]
MFPAAVLSWVSTSATALFFVLVGAGVDGSLSPAGWGTSIVLVVLAAAASAMSAMRTQRAVGATEGLLRRRLVRAMYDAGIAGAGPSGQFLSLATAGVEKAAQYRAGFLGPMLGAMTAPLLALGVMAAFVDARVAGLLALFVLLVPVVTGAFRRAVRPVGAEYRRTQGRLTAAFLDAVQALETLVYARAGRRVGRELAQRGEDHRRGVMRLLAVNQLLILVLDLAFSLTLVVAAAALALDRVQQGALTLGESVAVMLIALLATGPVDIVGQFFYIGIGGRAAEAQLENAMGRETRTPRAGNGGSSSAALELVDVTVSWPGGPTVLDGFSLAVRAGERVALVGPSGAGKSTVGALLQAHLSPSAGSVFVDGLDVAASEAAEVRARFSVVEQRTFLFLGTIADNLRVAAPGATDEELWEVLRLTGLANEVAAMPRGLDTRVGEHGALLSGGQAQRLGIARAWLRDAPILLLDEPTSQVDLAGEAAVLEALDRLAVGRTVLMIAHRPGAILAADRVVELAPSQGVPT